MDELARVRKMRREGVNAVEAAKRARMESGSAFTIRMLRSVYGCTMVEAKNVMSIAVDGRTLMESQGDLVQGPGATAAGPDRG